MSDPLTVLVTGGAGFIGSHTCVDLLTAGHDVVILDDFSNSSPLAVDRIVRIAGRAPLAVHECDLRDAVAVEQVFQAHPQIDAVIHFAAKKAVGESVRIPLEYYDINVSATTGLLRAMLAHGVHRLVFSSSCSIYGQTEQVPLTESEPAAPTNPYARSKWFCEQIIADACRRNPELSAVALRYFNPVGAHPSGLLGEDPRGVPNNIMPFMMQVAVGRLDRLTVFGNDYPTPDGTCVRDYIHVLDVADGHRVALEVTPETAPGRPGTGMRVFNLGTGVGTSVLGLVDAFGTGCGVTVPVQLGDRRQGDVAILVADPAAVEAAWGWRTVRDLTDMCRDAWNFQQLNPDGYSDLATAGATPANPSWRTQCA